MENIVVYNPGDLDCDGSLEWTDVPPGEDVTGSFTVSNVGTTGSLLDWEIESYPDWGTWSFDPDEGLYLTQDDSPFAVGVEVTAPNEEEEEFTGDITVVNKHNSSDSCTIPVTLKTPVNKPSQVLQFLQKLRQRFLVLQ